MPGFGENLRRERMMREVSLAEISAATRIGVHFLEALESDRFQDLPGGIFSRSFVRSYARFLGLDEQAIVQQFVRLADAPELPLPSPPARNKRLAAPGWSANFALGLLIALMATGTAWSGVHLWRDHRAHAVRAAATPAPRPAPPPAVPAAAPRTEAAAPAPIPAEIGSGPLAFTVAAAGEAAWISVQADGQPILETTLAPGDTHTIHAHASFEILTGNAGATQLAINGAPQPALGKDGAVVRYHYPPPAPDDSHRY